MSKQDNGGPACSRCGIAAARKQGNQWLCARHYRFSQMRTRARRDGKSVPSHEQLQNLLSQLNDMACPKCGVRMNWLRCEGAATVITLQHYRSGSMGFLCLSCNSRHAAQPGDEFMSIPSTHKRCPGCRAILHLDDFGRDSSGRYLNKKTYCRTCANHRVSAWKEGNRERYNEYQRRYRAKRKLEGNPVASGT